MKETVVLRLSVQGFLDKVERELALAYDSSASLDKLKESYKFLTRELRQLRAEVDISKHLTATESSVILEGIKGRLESYVITYGSKHQAFVAAMRIYDAKFMQDLEFNDKGFTKRLAGVLVSFFKPEFTLELWEDYHDN